MYIDQELSHLVTYILPVAKVKEYTWHDHLYEIF